jgi:hypothetical protein
MGSRLKPTPAATEEVPGGHGLATHITVDNRESQIIHATGHEYRALAAVKRNRSQALGRLADT